MLITHFMKKDETILALIGLKIVLYLYCEVFMKRKDEQTLAILTFVVIYGKT